MDIIQMRYFVSVFETHNYSRSAEQLHISRTALRKSVHNLEREINQSLFVNIANHLEPSPAAIVLYDSARVVLYDFDALGESITALKEGRTSTIRFECMIGSDAITSEHERAELVQSDRSANERRPFKLQVTAGSCAEGREDLLCGRTDYAAAVITSATDISEFDYTVGRQGYLYLAVSKRDPLANRDAVDIMDLHGVPIASQGTGFDIHDFLVNLAHTHGFELDITYTNPSLQECMTYVQSGSVVSYAFVDKPAKSQTDIVHIPFIKPELEWQYVSMARKDRGNPYLLRYFAGLQTDWESFRKQEGSAVRQR